MLIILEKHILSCESNSRYFRLYIMTFRARGLSVTLGISGICVRNDSELASASLSASLVSLERRRSLCMVIRAGILASWANMSKRKGLGLKASSRHGRIGFLSASLFPSSGGELASYGARLPLCGSHPLPIILTDAKGRSCNMLLL